MRAPRESKVEANAVFLRGLKIAFFVPKNTENGKNFLRLSITLRAPHDPDHPKLIADVTDQAEHFIHCELRTDHPARRASGRILMPAT